MTNKKLHVALLFGGNSSEHDVSKRSAHNVFDAMDKNKYDVSLFMFTKDGILLNNEYSQRIFDGEPEDAVVKAPKTAPTAHHYAEEIRIYRASRRWHSSNWRKVLQICTAPYTLRYRCSRVWRMVRCTRGVDLEAPFVTITPLHPPAGRNRRPCRLGRCCNLRCESI